MPNFPASQLVCYELSSRKSQYFFGLQPSSRRCAKTENVHPAPEPFLNLQIITSSR
ncbi:uncharacterized protein [Bemisia tabaci]|uniref:uncharacterized protein n=1 Tax=Bemisia tabaci TaxID=7038 RepID=UPI003B2879E0